MQKRKLANWTNYPVKEVAFHDCPLVQDVVETVSTRSSLIARGNGRCYGDASLAEEVISTLKLKNIIAFDDNTGTIEVEAGMLLSDILEFIVPLGWFLPVTPGTKFITVGGAIASNVHGKNHHSEGAFSRHVEEFKLVKADGSIVSITEESDTEIFHLTHGGMGLTGIIYSARIKLKRVCLLYTSPSPRD